MERVFRIDDRNTVLHNGSWADEYSSSLGDQPFIHAMAGEL